MGSNYITFSVEHKSANLMFANQSSHTVYRLPDNGSRSEALKLLSDVCFRVRCSHWVTASKDKSVESEFRDSSL